MITVTHFQEHILPLVTQAVAFPQAFVPPAIVAPFLAHSGNNFQSRACSPTKLTQQGSVSRQKDGSWQTQKCKCFPPLLKGLKTMTKMTQTNTKES